MSDLLRDTYGEGYTDPRLRTDSPDVGTQDIVIPPAPKPIRGTGILKGIHGQQDTGAGMTSRALQHISDFLQPSTPAATDFKSAFTPEGMAEAYRSALRMAASGAHTSADWLSQLSPEPMPLGPGDILAPLGGMGVAAPEGTLAANSIRRKAGRSNLGELPAPPREGIPLEGLKNMAPEGGDLGQREAALKEGKSGFYQTGPTRQAGEPSDINHMEYSSRRDTRGNDLATAYDMNYEGIRDRSREERNQFANANMHTPYDRTVFGPDSFENAQPPYHTRESGWNDEMNSPRAPADAGEKPYEVDEGQRGLDADRPVNRNKLNAETDNKAGNAINTVAGELHGQGGSKGPAGETTGAGAEAAGLSGRGDFPGGERRVQALSGTNNQYIPIPGQPRTVKLPGHGEIEARPLPPIQNAARQYLASQGKPYERAAGFEPLDIERSKRIADAYEAMKHDPTNPAVRKAYDALIEETLAQYKQLKNQGYDFEFTPPGEHPYAASPALGYLDMRDKGRLSVYPTIEGYGSAESLGPDTLENNPMLRPSGEKFGDKPALMNDIFRAVHDAFGHHGEGNPFFRAPGEDRAWGHHQILYSPEAAPAMTSELRGQNSWLNFGPFGAQNQGKSAADTVFADQKVGVMPDWTHKEGAPKRERPDDDTTLKSETKSNAGNAVNAVSDLRRARAGQTVTKPYREPQFQIYDDPREIAAEAASRVAPESENLRKVFNTSRGELAEIGEHGAREGTLRPEEYLSMARSPRGSEAAGNIMTPRNEQRIIDLLEEGGKHEGLRTGMDNWYVMDPLYQRMEKMFGPEEAVKRYRDLNAMIGMASPSSSVPVEIQRGLLAHYLAKEGRFEDFARYAGEEGDLAKIGVKDVPGHPWNSTAHAPAMGKYLQHGKILSDKPKVPAYVAASGVPETGFQTSAPVPDSHWSRAVGLADTRKGPYGIAGAGRMSEMQDIIPWWQEKIAEPMGIQSVPAQARLWGTASGRTGVDTPIGAPKLELLADHIARRARARGMSINRMRDMILRGEAYEDGGAT